MLQFNIVLWVEKGDFANGLVHYLCVCVRVLAPFKKETNSEGGQMYMEHGMKYYFDPFDLIIYLHCIYKYNFCYILCIVHWILFSFDFHNKKPQNITLFSFQILCFSSLIFFSFLRRSFIFIIWLCILYIFSSWTRSRTGKCTHI